MPYYIGDLKRDPDLGTDPCVVFGVWSVFVSFFVFRMYAFPDNYAGAP